MGIQNLKLKLTTGLSANKVFTNRLGEVEAFNSALERVMIAAGRGTELVEDAGAPRRHVLSFYGMGGIGKSRLSEELERRIDDGGGIIARARFDMSEPSAFDLEAIVIGLRAAFAVQGGPFRFPAFDLAFMAYWERAHPNRPLESHLDRSSALSRFGRRMEVVPQLTSAIDDVLDSVGIVSAARSVGGGIYAAIRDRVRTKGLLEECPFFGDLLEADPDYEALSFMPALLAWDLARTQAEHPSAGAVVFLDTWERIQAAEQRHLENLLMRIVYVMPNVLFVITGRSRLDWADDRMIGGQLELAGSHNWPGLAADYAGTDPRQHLVGCLSETDSHLYLADALMEGEDPAIPLAIRERIVAASDGLPLYLDLSVMHFAEVVKRGEAPTVEQFGGPLPAVVSRAMADLPLDERRLLRVASLLDGFDEELLAAGAPGVTAGVVRAFVERPFVEDAARAWPPYSLHDALRASVRGADVESRDHWEPGDWRSAAQRLGANLAARAERELRDTAADHLGRLDAVFAIGYALVEEDPEVADWLVGVGEHLAGAGRWEALARGHAGSERAETLSTVFAGFVAHKRGDMVQAHALLDRADTATLPARARGSVDYMMAKTLGEMGDIDAADAIYRRLEAEGGPTGEKAGRGRAFNDYLVGRLEAAYRVFAHPPADELAAWGCHCNAGGILRATGRFAESTAEYERAVAIGRRVGSPVHEARATTYLLEMLCWSDPVRALEMLPDAIERNLNLGLRVEAVHAHVAAAIAGAGSTDAAALEASIAAAEELRTGLGHQRSAFHPILARCFIAAVEGDVQAARAHRAELRELTDRREAPRSWAFITGVFTGEVTDTPSASEDEQVDWIDGRAAALAAWRGVLDARRT